MQRNFYVSLLSSLDNFPQLPGKAILRLSGDDSTVKFFCDYEGVISRETIIEVDWFVQGECMFCFKTSQSHENIE